MIQGKWFAEGSAAQCDAALQVDDERYTLTTTDGKVLSGNVKDLAVSDRLGNVERKITLEDGSVFATRENDAIDQQLKKHRTVGGLVHHLESHMKYVVLGLVVTTVFAFSFFKWGIPWASAKIAHALPQKTNELIAVNSLKFLDRFMFEPTKLSKEKQAEITAHFKKNLLPYGGEEIKYKLHYRNWVMRKSKKSDSNFGRSTGSVLIQIPNAMALPSGDIILTDKFVELCKTQEEMDSVLFHEMGHVERRHSLEMLIEGTFMTVAISLMIGDVGGFSDMGVGLGSALVSSSYSRGHESEADSFAFKTMLVAKKDPIAFSRVMNRMTEFMEEETGKKKHKGKIKMPVGKGSKKMEEKTFFDYLSSHPSTKERVEIARQYSECFKKGQATCVIVAPE